MVKRKQPFLLKLALSLFVILALGYLLVIGQFVLAPLLAALLLAILLTPVANFLERRWHFLRGLASITSLLLLLIVLFGLGFFFSSQLADFREGIPHLTEQFTRVFNDLQEWIFERFGVNIEKQFEYLNQGISKVLNSSVTILSFTFNIVTSGLLFLFFLLFFSGFILHYRGLLHRFIVQVFPEEHGEKLRATVAEIQKMVKSYLIGLFIQVFIISTLSTVVLSVLGVKYAILLGVLTGLLNVIPYVGIGISLLVAALFAFATSTPIVSFYVVLAYLGIHAIDGNIIIPFVIGSKVKINALFSFLGIIIGEQLWGIPGMFLCIPMMAIIRIIFENVKDLQPWAILLGEENRNQKKRELKISAQIILKEKE